MPSKCHGLCRFERKASKWTYVLGYKMCSVCETSMDAKAHKCYCCGLILRRGPQTNLSRKVRGENAVRL